MLKKSIICLTVLSIFIACQNKEEEPQVDTDAGSYSEMENVGQQMESAVGKSSERWEARKAKGDTMAMPYKDLQAYLPETVEGYTPEGGPSGNQMNMPGMGSWSEADQDYSNGDKRLEIKIVDYNSAMGAFSGVTSLYRMGFSSEDDNKKEGSVNLGLNDIAAYETVYKTEPRSSLVLIVADRFFVTLENDGEKDPEFLHRVVKNMNILKLAEK